MRPLFVRIARLLLALHSRGIHPMNDTSELVVWTPREFNAVADHVVNCALDDQRSWHASNNLALAQSLLEGRSFRLSVDGGRRSSTEAAIGLMRFAVNISEHGVATYELLARCGKLLENVSSAFLSEAMALEWGLQYLVELLKGKVTATRSQ